MDIDAREKRRFFYEVSWSLKNFEMWNKYKIGKQTNEEEKETKKEEEEFRVSELLILGMIALLLLFTLYQFWIIVHIPTKPNNHTVRC